MDSFDLGRLTDLDFEQLCKDLFESILDTPLEIFGPGRDRGIDLRSVSPLSTVVVQCKHWLRADAAALIRHMGKVEKHKIRKLSPDRYILACSVDLGEPAKDKLVEVLGPFVKSPGDIYGVRELEAELRNRPLLVRNNFRLWLNSAEVLEAMISKASFVRSSDLIEDLSASLRTYVPNESYSRAREMLRQRHNCIIAGIPGIGKTTLANVLAADHAAEGYELVQVSVDIDEANQRWSDDDPQLFYYDDFLGQSTLADKLHQKEDSRLLRLMLRVRNANNKRFVLTTREYILAEARQRYEKLARADLDPLKCVLDLSSYTQRIRAEILYNHVFFSRMPAENRAAFADETAYGPIIRHKNFNPRLVALSIDQTDVETEVPQQSVNRLLHNLDYPTALWEHIVDNQLSTSEVDLLFVLVSFARPVEVEDLGQSWRSFTGRNKSTATSREYRQCLEKLEGTMIRLHRSDSLVVVDYHNPSARDFMRDYLARDNDTVERLITSMEFFEQIDSIWTMATGWRGERLYAALAAHPDLVDQTSARLLSYWSDGPWLRAGATNLVRRCLIGTMVADRLDCGTLADEVGATLFVDDVVNDADDGDDLTELVKCVSKSSHSAIRRHKDKVLAGAIEWITGDMGDWSNAKAAEAYAYTIPEMIPKEVMDKIDDAIFSAAESVLGLAASERDSRHCSAADLQEILDYASSFDNPRLFEGYEEAKALLETLKVENPAPREGPGGHLKPTSEADKAAIARMFGSLRG